MSAAFVLLASGVASAQFDEDLPGFIDGVRTGVILNANSDPVTNATIESTARKWHQEIGGEISPKPKRNGYFASTMPDRTSVGLEAREYGDNKGDYRTDLVIVSGGDSRATIGTAKRYRNTTFVDIGQPLPCVTAEGQLDQTGACEGQDFALPGNYSAVTFEVEDPAYLAGVIAASASRNDRLGIISGLSDCEECNRYIRGYVMGALSINPDINIELAFLADGDSEAFGFGDLTSARTFAKAFIDVYQPDVLLPVAKGASIGMLEAACEAGIKAIGTGVDFAGHAELQETCLLTNITKDTRAAVRRSIIDYSNGLPPKHRPMTLADDGVGLTDEWRRDSTLPVDVEDRYEDARAALITGQVDACPVDCGMPIGLGSAGEPAADTPAEGDDETADG